MDGNTRAGFEFAGFRLDVRQQTLVAPDGRLIPLPGRAFEVLRLLVERPGVLVEKQALLHAVWPRAVVEENNLNQCIMTLRRALGEEPGERRFILTVPGRGFKFIAPVRTLAMVGDGVQRVQGADASRPAPDARTGGASVPRRARTLAIGIGGGLAAALAVFLLAYRSTRPPTDPSDYVALTDVSGSATAPAISPDGRLLAFIRDGGSFLSSGQIWLKLLPDGEPVQLTHESGAIFAPAFSADGTHVVYSVVPKFAPDVTWDTWTVPVSGGPPLQLMPNASGLTYLGAHELMYSEFFTGIHLGLVTSRDDRSARQVVYLPEHERGMAHYSALSPDRHAVLVVEMGDNGDWQRCRLVPFDGSAPGRLVGPEGACTSAAWSPDGRWMYFSIERNGRTHLWRQGYPQGSPEQVTFGPADEDTVAVMPDGKSLLASVGRKQTILRIHESGRDRRLPTDGSVAQPRLSADAQRLYFLSIRDATPSTAEVVRMDVTSGRTETLVAGYEVQSYDVSADESRLVFSVRSNGALEIWTAPLDRHAAPVRLVSGGDEALFDRSGAIYYRNIERTRNFLHRLAGNAGAGVRVISAPILDFMAVAPDGRNAVVSMPVPGGTAAMVMAPLDGGKPRTFLPGWDMSARWSRDGSRFLVDAVSSVRPSQPGDRALAFPVGPDGLPEPGSDTSRANALERPLSVASYAADPSTYVYLSFDARRNIYRIPLH